MKKKFAILLVALALVVGCVVGGTLAWLTATSNKVENTFSVGDITITLDETTGTEYKILPGGYDDKDPTITVEVGSEKCYVYALVENTVKLNGTVVATPNIDETKWTEVGTAGDATLYRYNEVVDASTAEKTVPVFTSVVYSDTITKGDITTLKDTTITVTAYAHQSENTNQTTADAAANAWAGTTAPATN